MEQQWHDIFLHNDTGDAAFHKGAPLLLEALQVISDVQSISAATRLGLHLRDAEHGSALDRLGSTFTDKHVNQEHAAHAAAAAPLLQGFADLFRECVAPAAPSAAPASVVTVAELDGLLLPASAAAAATSSAAAVAPELRAHPMFSYAAFRRQLDRLSALMSSGEVFSACEPRVKVLQSRFRLYRAYNGGREDEFHPTFGGGDIKRAPKCDLRRIETCVSAGSVVRFLEELLRDRPDYPLCAEDVAPEEEAAATTTTDGAAASTATTTSRLSVAEAVRRFFGSTVATSERVLTEEGLCLRPSYAADSADRWLSLQQLADSGGSPRAVNASRLLQHLLSTSGGADGEGELLALLLRPILTRVLHSGTSYDRLELELTVSGADATELPRLARWCARSGLLETCPGVFFRLHIAQDAYADAAPHTTASRFFSDVLHNVFSPIWQAHLAEAAEAAAAAAAGAAAAAAPAPAPSHEAAAVRALLRRTTGFAVTLNHAAAVQEMPATGDPSRQFPLPRPSPPGSSAATTPPDAFFVYHVWRNVQLLNAFLLTSATAAAAAATTTTEAATSARGARSAYTFTLHGGANSRTLFGESVLGLLLADVVVNPAAAFEWSPLTYLYTLTQRHVLLTPSRNRCSSASVQQTLSTTAMPLAVQVGMHVSVATLDPLFYDTTNDALSEELMELTKQRGLANADVTEMCLRSLESSAGCLSWAERRHLLGYAWPHAQARYNQFPATQVSSLRLHHRACALEHELDIVLTAARHGGGGGDSGGGGVPTCTAADEAHLRATLFLPPAADDGAGSSVTAPRRTTCASTRALQRERDPLLLQSLSGYHAHEAQMEYPRILISGPDTAGPSAAAKRLMAAMATREAYQRFVCHQPQEGRSADTPAAATTVTAWRNGVLDVEEPPPQQQQQQQQRHRHVDSGAAALPTWSQFQRDVQTLRRLASADPTVAKYASKRLDMLESKYKLHVALTNDDEETYTITTSATASGRRRVVQPIRGDAHNCVKVDVHCHMASGMTAKSLLLFMQKKVNDHPDDVVGVNTTTGAPITLVDFFYDVLGEQQQQQQQQSGSRAARVAQRLGEMPIAALQVHAGNATFHRFDRFNHRFSPMGITALRSLFLKTDNFMRGRYFAELIRGAFAQSEQEGGTFTENRLSIYGRERHEWDRLSRWFVLHGMSHRTNSWMVQVPRLFHLYQRSGQLRTFHEMLANIFEPLWQASLHPEQHPYLHYFLSHVSGFDSVDNESDREPDQMIDTPPAQWTSSQNPPFAYYMFYMWANITTLNRYRARRGFSTFHFRPHAGESGDPDHMADVFLLADGVGHGINLQKRPVLQYLYYLAQIPLAIVPMSNNVLFCRYKDHPLPSFLYRGLNIAVGTDGALIFHRTEQPLLEEYGTAEALWNLSAADVCELAANSVRTSGFAAARKAAWLGPLYYLRSVAGNDVTRSHVPQTRCAFRYEAYMEEVTYLQSRASQEMACRAMRTPLEEEVDIMDAVGISRAELLERRWSGLPIRGKAPPPQQQQEEPQRICKTHDVSHV